MKGKKIFLVKLRIFRIRDCVDFAPIVHEYLPWILYEHPINRYTINHPVQYSGSSEKE